jgi:hypothetical protein
MLRWLGLALCGVLTLAAPGASAQGRQEPLRRHHVSVLLGGTSAPSENASGFTYGLDYEYRFTERFGLGGVVERAGGAIGATSLIALADLHITPRLVLQAGPGVVFENGERFAVGRVGAYYEFELGRYTLAPALSYDITGRGRPNDVVFGVLLGRQF